MIFYGQLNGSAVSWPYARRHASRHGGGFVACGGGARPHACVAASIRARITIVLLLFLGPLATALLIGGHAIVDQLLRTAADAREASHIGDIVFTMPGGAFLPPLVVQQSDGGADGKHRGAMPGSEAPRSGAGTRHRRLRLGRALKNLPLNTPDCDLALLSCSHLAAERWGFVAEPFLPEIRFPLLRIMF
jgi:hypothetical protein